LATPLLQVLHVINIEVSEEIAQGLIQLIGLDEVAIGRSGGGKSTGNRDALRSQLLDHFP
jgi:hypothetical protein